MTAKQFMGWENYARLEPFNELRADYRAASIATVIANVNRDPKTRRDPYSYEDFRLKFDKDDVAPGTVPQWQLQKSAFMHAMAQAEAEQQAAEERLKKAV